MAGKTYADLSRFSFFEIWATTKMMPRQKYYVVFEGRERGIYDSWERCQPLVYRYKGAVFKSFDSLEVAENHMYEYVQKKYGVQAYCFFCINMNNGSALLNCEMVSYSCFLIHND
ncbi:Ribonuclease H [Nymphaea thermarum]|nr:Ribonuclease H [Nymphaea thermarum]